MVGHWKVRSQSEEQVSVRWIERIEWLKEEKEKKRRGGLVTAEFSAGMPPSTMLFALLNMSQDSVCRAPSQEGVDSVVLEKSGKVNSLLSNLVHTHSQTHLLVDR